MVGSGFGGRKFILMILGTFISKTHLTISPTKKQKKFNRKSR